jgi:two-component system osmolarity sensor histidine kinase EnvZ
MQQRVNLSGLVTEIAREAARLPDVQMFSDVTSGITVNGSAIDLRRVVNNLIENARRYGKTPGTSRTDLDIRCWREGDRAVLEVSDHGGGVPESELEHLLRPFTRLDSARSQANGAGLGLAIVERVVQRHGAALRVSNRADGGLMARITFAIAPMGKA